MIKNKKTRTIVSSLIAIVTFVLLSVSYAYWQLTRIQTEENQLITGCFDLTVTESESINLNNAFPITDEEGMKLKPYTFIIKNNCSITAKVEINLEISNQSTLLDNHIRLSLINSENPKNNAISSLNNLTLTTATIGDNYDKAYLMKESILEAGEEIEYNLRLWLYEEIQLGEAVNSIFISKVSIVATPTLYMDCSKNENAGEGSCGKLRVAQTYGTETTPFLYGPLPKNTIESIEFLKHKNIPEGVDLWDVSENEDESVIAWYEDLDGNNLYEVYIGSNYGVTANENSSNLFSYLTKMTNLDLTNLYTQNATNMGAMFSRVNSLTYLDVSAFDTKNVTNMSSMFNEMKSLINLDLSNFNTSKVTNMTNMFSSMSALTDLDVSSFDTSEVDGMGSMFVGLQNLTSLDITNFNTSKVTNMGYMFSGAKNLTTLDLSNFNTSLVTTMSNMFYNLKGITNLDLSSFDTRNVTNMGYMFYGMSNVESLDITNFNTSKVTNMDYMFINMSNLKSIDLSNFNTSNVTSMNNMFHGTSSITKLDLSNFVTNKVTGMQSMFGHMTNLKELDISSFNTSKVTNMQNMFYEDISLTSLDLRHFDVSKVTSMSLMFSRATALTTIDIGTWDTSNVSNMSTLFSGCTALINIDMSNFSFKTGLTMFSMFNQVQNDCAIKVKSQEIKDYILNNIRGNLTGIYY